MGLHRGSLRLRGVRVGLALFELRIRRAAFIWTEKKEGRGVPEFTPNYSASELASLCGLPESRVRSALRELLELGILAEFSPDVDSLRPSLSEVKLAPEQRSALHLLAWPPHQAAKGPNSSAGPGTCVRVELPGPCCGHPRRLPPLLLVTTW